MNTNRMIAFGLTGGMLIATTLLVVDRGGLLAWVGIVLGSLLFLKFLRRPSPRDAALAAALLGIWAAAWGATWMYVVSTWESGEVVQIDVADEHTARVWVLDTDDGPVMYYDAPPDVASSLLAGASLSVTRDGRVEDACASASRVEELPEERIQGLLEAMEEKYGSRNRATDVFYALIGVKRNRVGLVVTVVPCE